jgi:hypothetical protein
VRIQSAVAFAESSSLLLTVFLPPTVSLAGASNVIFGSVSLDAFVTSQNSQASVFFEVGHVHRLRK